MEQMTSQQKRANFLTDNLRCRECGDPMPDNDLRNVCRKCQHQHSIRVAYRRFFMRDFK